MKRLFIILCLFVCLPATALGAGFARESIFLSKNSVTEGESVLIHTIVSNEATISFSGTLVLTEEDIKIGTVPVTLHSGEAQAVSLSWKPAAGSHTITATLTDPSGSAVEKQSATFRINTKPLPATAHTTSAEAVDSSEEIQQTLAEFSPGVAQAAAPIFSTLDSLRGSAIGVIDKGIDWAKTQVSPGKKAGTVLGVETTQERGVVGTLWFILATVLLYILSVAHYLVAHAGIFYPLFAILFLFGLWRFYKRMRTPRFDNQI